MNRAGIDPNGRPLPSIAELRRICQWGEDDPFLYSRYLMRPISIFATRVFLALGLSPHLATLMSVASALTAAAIMAVPGPHIQAWGIPFVYLSTYFDSVDGETDRYLLHRGVPHSELVGTFADKLAHCFSFGVIYFGLGLGLYLETSWLPALILGFVTCLCSSNFPEFSFLWSVAGEILKNPSDQRMLRLLGFDRTKTERISSRLSPKANRLVAELLGFPVPGAVLLPAAILFDLIFPSARLYGVLGARALFLAGFGPLFSANVVRMTLACARAGKSL